MPNLPLPMPWLILLAYIALISLCSVVVCIYDKTISKKNNVKLRIPEKSLFIWSALGGSVAMFLCMLVIRHKTKHFSFMVGIPCIILLQAALIFVLTHFHILPPLF
ncbi:MAG: DUF1294 domain-containing protein [Clostridia bacterium]|nr:DUF1294 domain-containing protein [Clostridia bacterium]